MDRRILVPDHITLEQFKADYDRLYAEAMRQHYTGSNYFEYRIRRTISNCYGEKCFKCKRVIKIKFNCDPLYRRLSKGDAALSQLAKGMPIREVGAAFHTRCWKD